MFQKSVKKSLEITLTEKLHLKLSKDRYSMLMELQNYGVVEPGDTSAVTWPKPILLQKRNT